MFSIFKKEKNAFLDQELFPWLQTVQSHDQCHLYYVGTQYYENKMYVKALALFHRAAELGHANAQYQVGYMYDMGLGVSKDRRVAMEWYLEAAKQQKSEAMVQIGYLYHNGQGVPRDYKAAMEWYLKSSDNPHSQNNIGTLYKRGQGVTKDLPTAMKWYTKAAEQGNAMAQYNVAFNYEFIKEVRDLQQAANWYQEAADNGFIVAKAHLFLMRLRGYYPRNDEQDKNSENSEKSNEIDHNEKSPLLEE